MSKSTYLANAILDEILGATNWTPPATVYLGMYSTAPTGYGTGGTEFTSGAEAGYARKAVTNNSTNFPNASAGVKSTGVDQTFATNSGGSAWANAVAFGIFDASTGGNLLGYGSMTPLACAAGSAITIPSGSVIWTET
jgi:hypothetical protein